MNLRVAESDGQHDVLWPRAPRQVRQKALAPRLDTLSGKTIAELWDFVYCGDKVFETLQRSLAERFPGVRFIGWREFGNTHGPDERRIVAELPQKLRALGVDAVISGMGC